MKVYNLYKKKRNKAVISPKSESPQKKKEGTFYMENYRKKQR